MARKLREPDGIGKNQKGKNPFLSKTDKYTDRWMSAGAQRKDFKKEPRHENQPPMRGSEFEKATNDEYRSEMKEFPLSTTNKDTGWRVSPGAQREF